MKGKALILILAAVLIFPVAADSAAVVFDNGVLDAAAGTFTFDILMGGVTLDDVVAWSLSFDISRRDSNDSFSFDFDPDAVSDHNYIYFGNSDDYYVKIEDVSGVGHTYSFIGDDSAADFSGDYIANGLLARITLDDVAYGDWFTIDLEAVNSFFEATDFSIDYIQPLDYDIQVVPIPAAVWLLGSGLVGLAAVRRRKK
jgi:hypothetical protein